MLDRRVRCDIGSTRADQRIRPLSRTLVFGARGNVCEGLSGHLAEAQMNGAVLKLPAGLYVCPACGSIRGTTMMRTLEGVQSGPTSVCLCDGIPCKRCGRGKVRRPTGDWYDPETSGWSHTPYFGGMLQCGECGGRRPVDYRPSPATPKHPGRYRVLVDDNFHFSDEDERYEAGVFDEYEDAVAKCKAIVEECLREQFKPGMNADDLYGAYMMYAEDPWISPTPEGTQRFSAWDYARARSLEICVDGPEDTQAADPDMDR